MQIHELIYIFLNGKKFYITIDYLCSLLYKI